MNTNRTVRPAAKLTTVLSRYRRHLADARDRRRPSELAVLLESASPSERADLMAMISRHDAWDDVWGTAR